MELKDSNDSIMVHFEAYACDDYGDGPKFASNRIDKRFLDNLKDLQNLCRLHDLTEVRQSIQPDMWGPQGIEDEIRLHQSPELVITASSFWFVDRPKHSNYTIETRAQGIDELLALIELAQPDDVLYLGENDELQDLVEEDSEDVQPSES